MPHAVCVYCGSSSRVAQAYWDMARDLGAMLARQGYSLVFGGGKNPSRTYPVSTPGG
jgi:predicted Rossmann-fold nucleotide-binding protein